MLSAIGQRGSVAEFQSGHFASLKTKMPRLALTHELRAIGEYVLRILWESGVEPSCSAVSRRPAERSSSGFPH